MQNPNAVCDVPSDWPDQTIRCRHCGLGLQRIDLPPPEGPTMNGMHGWIHTGGTFGVFCPAVVIEGEVKMGTAEPSEYVKTVFDRAIETARIPPPSLEVIKELKADRFHAHNGMMEALAERDTARAENASLLWLVQWLQRTLEGTERRLVATGVLK